MYVHVLEVHPSWYVLIVRYVLVVRTYSYILNWWCTGVQGIIDLQQVCMRNSSRNCTRKDTFSIFLRKTPKPGLNLFAEFCHNLGYVNFIKHY